MSPRAKAGMAVISGLALLAALVVVTAGPPPATPNPPGTFSFAAMGDAPYYPWEEWQYRLVRQALDEHDLAFVIEVGDIFWRPCADARYRQSYEEFQAFRHPVIFTPGDNEWTDCWEPGSGGYAPLERLARLREIFLSRPERSLGVRPIVVDHPLARRTTGQVLANLTRPQVPGSPEVGWVRVVVTLPTAADPRPSFAFENHVVPAWKYW